MHSWTCGRLNRVVTPISGNIKYQKSYVFRWSAHIFFRSSTVRRVVALALAGVRVRVRDRFRVRVRVSVEVG